MATTFVEIVQKW